MCQSLVRPVFSISGIFVVSGTPAVIGCGVKSAATLVHAFRGFVDSYACRRCFAVAGPSTWISLPDSLYDDSALSLSIFRRHLKTYFFAKY